MIERSLVLIKPDGVERALVGKIVSRFEDAGLKIVGMKMVWVDKSFAKRHYTEDLEKRRGKFVREAMVNFLTEGPVIAVCLEGIEAVEVVRKMVGETEPKAALPGTIRGDFCHISFMYADSKKKVVKNIIHASGSSKEAKQEIMLWFKPEELHSYKNVHEKHVM